MNIRRLALPIVLGLLLLAGTLASLAQAAGAGFHEAPLPGANDPEEIYQGTDGNVWISDYTPGRVWRVNPGTGAFKRFNGLPSATDARPGPGGYVWWLDPADRWLGRLEIATSAVTTWTLGVNSVWGLAFDEQGRVWTGAYGGAALIRFDPVSHQRCIFSMPDNNTGGYMVAYAGAIWYGADADGLGRLNTTSNSNTFWSFGAAGFGAWNVAASQAAGVWIVDDSRALVGRVDPDLNTLTTYTSTLLTQDSAVLPRGQNIWFTDKNSWVVALDPAAANGTIIPLTETTGTINPVCTNAGAGITHTISSATGALAFSSGTVTSTVENGMTHYRLPDGSFPYGLADVNGDLWVVDLDRSTVSVLEAPHKLYLPLIDRH